MESPIFRQLFDTESSTFTYLLGDAASGEAVLIDPVLERVDRDLALVEELGLRVKYVLDTHVHADHVTGAGEIRRRTRARTGVAAAAKVPCVDLALKEGDTVDFGSFEIRVLETPGHTDGCLSFVCGNRVFTGDALTIRAAGRTDFQEGSASRLYSSLTEKLFRLPDDTLVYPGHDYQGQTSSTIGEEKRFNRRIGGGKTLEEFVETMNGLNLPPPKKIETAVAANLKCGLKDG
jgi:glyoxylase-like metal-dependent hydrolase (beta-lactamase superfamily II)